MDPGTGLTILGTGVGGAKVVEKLLGPTADYVGEGLQSWAQRRIENTRFVFQKAAMLLGDRLDEPGSVSPRVLDRILREAPVAEDRLTANYLAGVLAASRSDKPRDDRGAALVALVERLTTYQIHGHFILYQTIRQLYRGQDLSPKSSKGRNLSTTFMPMGSFVNALRLTAEEMDQEIISHIIWGLFRETLIAEGFSSGSAAHIKERYPSANGGGIVFKPSLQGAELFLWAHGYSKTSPNVLLDEHTDLPALVPIEPITDAYNIPPNQIKSTKRSEQG